MVSRVPRIKKLLESQADWKFYYLYSRNLLSPWLAPGALVKRSCCPPLLVFFPRLSSWFPLPVGRLLAPSRRRPNLSFLNFLLISYRSRNRDRIKRNVHDRWTVTEMHRYTDGMPSLIFRSSPSSPVSPSTFSAANREDPPLRSVLSARGTARHRVRLASGPSMLSASRQKKHIFPQNAALVALQPPTLSFTWRKNGTRLEIPRRGLFSYFSWLSSGVGWRLCMWCTVKFDKVFVRMKVDRYNCLGGWCW